MSRQCFGCRICWISRQLSPVLWTFMFSMHGLVAAEKYNWLPMLLWLGDNSLVCFGSFLSYLYIYHLYFIKHFFSSPMTLLNHISFPSLLVNLLLFVFTIFYFNFIRTQYIWLYSHATASNYTKKKKESIDLFVVKWKRNSKTNEEDKLFWEFSY